jgi:hypothetical protein
MRPRFGVVDGVFVDARRVPHSGTRTCCAEKIMGLFGVLEATKRLAVTSSPIENSATSDAHAN